MWSYGLFIYDQEEISGLSGPWLFAFASVACGNQHGADAPASGVIAMTTLMLQITMTVRSALMSSSKHFSWVVVCSQYLIIYNSAPFCLKWLLFSTVFYLLFLHFHQQFSQHICLHLRPDFEVNFIWSLCVWKVWTFPSRMKLFCSFWLRKSVQSKEYSHMSRKTFLGVVIFSSPIPQIPLPGTFFNQLQTAK